MYVCETWFLNPREEQKIEKTCDNRALSKICGYLHGNTTPDLVAVFLISKFFKNEVMKLQPHNSVYSYTNILQINK
jgi:hypothetical protein